MVDANLLANVLSITLLSAALLIALRAFFISFQTIGDGNHRLVILGLSMALLALTAMASFADDNIHNLPINVNWFKYIGQTVCFLFICLSLLGSSEYYLRRLLYVQVAIFFLLLGLLSPLFAGDFPYPTITKVALGGSRCAICFVVFFFYVVAFMRKETRFSFFMALSFLLLAMGYFLNVPKYLQHDLLLLDNIGDCVRVTGVLALLVAMFAG